MPEPETPAQQQRAPVPQQSEGRGAHAWIQLIREALPRGRLLSDLEWTRRHRGIVILLWAHVIGVGTFGLLQGYTVAHCLVESTLIAVPAVIATIGKGRVEKTVAASLGLLLSSAVIVHLSGGVIEAHFHFFVVVGVLTLYQDWLPFLLAIGFVVVHHALIGLVDPRSVFNHSGAWRHPGRWALLHGAFVLASSCAYLVQWRMNERARMDAEDSYRKLRSSEERFRSLVQNAMEAAVLVDPDGLITYQSPSVMTVLGYAPDELLGRNGFDLVHPDDLERAAAVMADVSATPRASGVAEVRGRNARGQWRWCDARITNLIEDPNVNGMVVNFRDITERKSLEEKLVRQAFHDPLTGLANRLLLMDRVGHGLDRVARSNSSMSLIFLDLDNFKHINDSLGHEVGDQLLTRVGNSLKALVRTVDTAARLGGDEFAVLLEDTPEEGAGEVAQRLLSALEQPVSLGGRDLYVSASIGVAVTDTGEQTVSELLRNADLAMYVAKGRGKGTYAVFQPEMYSASLETLSLTTDFRKAVESNELILFYQPIVDLRTGEVRALEALARWQHPVRGLLGPGEFIDMAEESGLIVDMGRHLLFKACVQVQSWRKTFSPKIKVGFNFSARQLQEGDVASMVREALNVSGLPAENLVLEITESLLVGDVTAIVGRLMELRELGICIAIDDFGTGHSSLALLKHLPLDFMKIDRAFVQTIADSSQDISFVQAIINLAASLQLKTLGEGIETEAQRDALLDLSCTTGQGYLFAKPMDARDMELYLGGKFLSEATTQPVEPSLEALPSV